MSPDDGYLLVEDFVLIDGAVNTGMYKAARYQNLGYDHLREDAIEELEKVRDMADEALDRFEEIEIDEGGE